MIHGLRGALDFRADRTQEEKIATRHGRQRADEWLNRWMGLGQAADCK